MAHSDVRSLELNAADWRGWALPERELMTHWRKPDCRCSRLANPISRNEPCARGSELFGAFGQSKGLRELGNLLWRRTGRNPARHILSMDVVARLSLVRGSFAIVSIVRLG